MSRIKSIVLCSALLFGTAYGRAPENSPADRDKVITNFSLLIGFPSEGQTAAGGTLLVPGTVIPIAPDSLQNGDRRAVVDKSLAFTRTVEKLWNTFRLDPGRRLQDGVYGAAGIGEALSLPPMKEANVAITATLVSFTNNVATYRIVLRQGDKTLADSTVNATRGGQAVVGATDGAAAPYVFLIIEPELAESGEAKSLLSSRAPGIHVPKSIYKVAPKYPEEAKQSKISGVVVLRLIIDTEGNPLQISALEESNSSLAGAAIDAVKQWRFEPARRADGTPVKVFATITVEFKLK